VGRIRYGRLWLTANVTAAAGAPNTLPLGPRRRWFLAVTVVRSPL